MNVFDTNFVNKLKDTLESELSKNKAIQRKELCSVLELDETYQDMISFVVTNDILPGYEIIPGRFGGIAKEGTMGSSPSSSKTKRPAKKALDENFLKILRETLFEVCSDGKYHFRDAIVEAMGDKESKEKTKKLISDAFSAGKLPEFEMVRGRYGGIKLREDNDDSSTENTENETNNDTFTFEEDSVVISNANDNDQDLVFATDDDYEKKEEEGKDVVDLSDYNLDHIDDDIKNILIRKEREIQNITDSNTV